MKVSLSVALTMALCIFGLRIKEMLSKNSENPGTINNNKSWKQEEILARNLGKVFKRMDPQAQLGRNALNLQMQMKEIDSLEMI